VLFDLSLKKPGPRRNMPAERHYRCPFTCEELGTSRFKAARREA
jgi:hypothetical protein